MKYKGFLLATAGGAAGLSGAQAADLPMKAPAPVFAPTTSWTGFYGGVHLGANWQMANGGYDPATSSSVFGEPASSQKTFASGVIGGGQIGYNWQFGSTVWGIEGSISGLTGKGGTTSTQFSPGKGNAFESQITWLATVRGRAGWLIDPSTLIYATGGAAWGHVENKFNPNGLVGDPNVNRLARTTKSVSKTKSGWVVGAGLEHMFTMLSRSWTLGVEVLYVDLGASHANATAPADTAKRTRFTNSVAIGQVKLNYKF